MKAQRRWASYVVGCWLTLLPGWASAAERKAPTVIGEAREGITASDVDAMLALAQPLVSAPLEPVLINVTASHRPGQTPAPERATIYFAPSEADARSWRGYCLRCVTAAGLWLDDEPTHWRKEGAWQTLESNGIEEYILPMPRDRSLHAWPAADVSKFQFVSLSSKLPTRLILELIDTAEGYRRLLPSGSELPMTDLRLNSIYTHNDAKGGFSGDVEFLVPAGRLRGTDPIQMHVTWQEKEGWKIGRVFQGTFY